MSLFDIYKAKQLGAGAGSLFEAKAGSKLNKDAWKKGFNKWDEEWEIGVYSSSTGAKADYPGNVRNKNTIAVLPGTSYYIKAPKVLRLYYYGSDGSYLRNEWVSRNAVKALADDVYFINFYYEGTTYDNDICINISGEHDGEYVPYNG